ALRCRMSAVRSEPVRRPPRSRLEFLSRGGFLVPSRRVISRPGSGDPCLNVFRCVQDTASAWDFERLRSAADMPPPSDGLGLRAEQLGKFLCGEVLRHSAYLSRIRKVPV